MPNFRGGSYSFRNKIKLHLHFCLMSSLPGVQTEDKIGLDKGNVWDELEGPQAPGCSGAGRFLLDSQGCCPWQEGNSTFHDFFLIHAKSTDWEPHYRLLAVEPLRATPSVLTSGKEKKYVTSPSKLNLAVTMDKLGINTFHNTPEVLQELAPPRG